MYHQQPITTWAKEDRPREKMLQRGTDALTDAELLAIILGSGTREMSALALARQVLDQVGGLSKLARAGVAELTQIKGIGPAKAIAMVSTFELGRRKALFWDEVFSIRSASDSAKYLVPRLADQEQELFYVLFLNQNHEVKAEKLIHRGGVANTVVDIRLVFREAINHLATALIVAHNHPSGSLRPSHADMKLTQKLVRAGKFLDIRVLDHLIVSHRGHYSFVDEGVMPTGDEEEKTKS